MSQNYLRSDNKGKERAKHEYGHLNDDKIKVMLKSICYQYKNHPQCVISWTSVANAVSNAFPNEIDISLSTLRMKYAFLTQKFNEGKQGSSSTNNMNQEIYALLDEIKRTRDTDLTDLPESNNESTMHYQENNDESLKRKRSQSDLNDDLTENLVSLLKKNCFNEKNMEELKKDIDNLHKSNHEEEREGNLRRIVSLMEDVKKNQENTNTQLERIANTIDSLSNTLPRLLGNIPSAGHPQYFYATPPPHPPPPPSYFYQPNHPPPPMFTFPTFPNQSMPTNQSMPPHPPPPHSQPQPSAPPPLHSATIIAYNPPTSSLPHKDNENAPEKSTNQ